MYNFGMRKMKIYILKYEQECSQDFLLTFWALQETMYGQADLSRDH